MPCSLQSVCHAAQQPADINLWLQDLDWSLNGVVLQSSLRSLTFGFRFYQNFRSFRRC